MICKWYKARIKAVSTGVVESRLRLYTDDLYRLESFLPPPLQSSLPAGWLASTGRESNPLDRFERFQITFSFPFPGLILALPR